MKSEQSDTKSLASKYSAQKESPQLIEIKSKKFDQVCNSILSKNYSLKKFNKPPIFQDKVQFSPKIESLIEYSSPYPYPHELIRASSQPQLNINSSYQISHHITPNFKQPQKTKHQQQQQTNSYCCQMTQSIDKDGLLIYCSELKKQLEGKNAQLLQKIEECSHYRSLDKQRELSKSDLNCDSDKKNKENISKHKDEQEVDSQQSQQQLKQIDQLKVQLEIALKEQLDNEEYINSQKIALNKLQSKHTQLQQDHNYVLEQQSQQIEERQQYNQQEIKRLKNECSCMQDILQTKEQLELQLQNRITLLDKENQSYQEDIHKLHMQQQEEMRLIDSLRDEIDSLKNYQEREHSSLDCIEQSIESIEKQIQNMLQNQQLPQSYLQISIDILSQYHKNNCKDSYHINNIIFPKIINHLFNQMTVRHSIFILLKVIFIKEYMVIVLRLEEEAEAKDDQISEIKRQCFEQTQISNEFKEIINQTQQLFLVKQENETKTKNGSYTKQQQESKSGQKEGDNKQLVRQSQHSQHQISNQKQIKILEEEITKMRQQLQNQIFTVGDFIEMQVLLEQLINYLILNCSQ